MTHVDVISNRASRHRSPLCYCAAYRSLSLVLQQKVFSTSNVPHLLRHKIKHCSWATMAGLDSLAILQQELQRIGKNQLVLRSAIDSDKAIVVHPSQQALLVPLTLWACPASPCLHHANVIRTCGLGTYLQALEDEEEEEEKKAKKAKPKYVVSGGLTGFGVAQDLLNIDFSPPEEAPEEFRAVPFNEKRVTILKSGKSGWCPMTMPGHASKFRAALPCLSRAATETLKGVQPNAAVRWVPLERWVVVWQLWQ